MSEANIVRDLVEVNDVNSTIAVPHWGITLRTLFGAALAAQQNPVAGERRNYTVLHKDTPIATIFVRQHDDFQP